MKISKIEISFPESVEVTEEEQRSIVQYALAICKRYEDANPDRVMWPAGVGYKIIDPSFNSENCFDENTYAISCAERQNFTWQCAKCHLPEMEHGFASGQAGSCEYEPKKKGQ